MDSFSNWAMRRFQINFLSAPALAEQEAIAGGLYRDDLLVEPIQIPYSSQYIRSITSSSIVFRREASDLCYQDVVMGRFGKMFPNVSMEHVKNDLRVVTYYMAKTQEWHIVEFGEPDPDYEVTYPNAKARVIQSMRPGGPK